MIARYLIIAVRDQMERFGFTRSNALQDFFSASFYADVRIDRAYWPALASCRGLKNPADTVVSLAAFKKRIKPGGQLKLIYAPPGTGRSAPPRRHLRPLGPFHSPGCQVIENS